MIEASNNYKCPKIQANYYDDWTEEKIRPLNSTVFYMYYSGSAFRRYLAKVFMSATNYPNEKIRNAYTRFFA